MDHMPHLHQQGQQGLADSKGHHSDEVDKKRLELPICHLPQPQKDMVPQKPKMLMEEVKMITLMMTMTQRPLKHPMAKSK